MQQVAFIQRLNYLHSFSKLCFEQSMLSIKDSYAFYQTSFCLLSNVNMITTKYLRLIIRVVVVLNSI